MRLWHRILTRRAICTPGWTVISAGLAPDNRGLPHADELYRAAGLPASRFIARSGVSAGTQV